MLLGRQISIRDIVDFYFCRNPEMFMNKRRKVKIWFIFGMMVFLYNEIGVFERNTVSKSFGITKNVTVLYIVKKAAEHLFRRRQCLTKGDRGGNESKQILSN